MLVPGGVSRVSVHCVDVCALIMHIIFRVLGPSNVCSSGAFRVLVRRCVFRVLVKCVTLHVSLFVYW